MKLFRFFFFILLLGLQACNREDKPDHLITIAPKSVASTLFYSGTIQPLRSMVISSPADGVVMDMPFQYGEEIKAGDLLFQVSSTKFLSDYKNALMQYIKAKSEYNNNQTQLSESEFLHQHQLISDDEFKMKQSNFYASRLALLQAKDVLQQLLQQLDIKNVDLYNLTIADIDKITQALHLQVDAENLKILAPAQGVVLSASKGEDDNKKITQGDAVKAGDVLAVIGDMSGLSVQIKVNELTVNQLHIGQKVSITGIAFPDYALEGEIKRVDRQGEMSSSGMPSFAVEIVVPKLTPEQQHAIHVGMSAKIEINIEEDSKVMLPIAAILQKQDGTYVNFYDEKSNKTKLIPIKTGKTTMDSVAVISGVKPGDKIVLPN